GRTGETPVATLETFMAIGKAPRRILSLQPSATVILRDLGKLDCLAACTKYCVEVCPEISAKGITIVADSWTAQREQILNSKPELVIASVPYQEKALAEIMKSGARFLGLAPKSLDDIYLDIAVIAGIMNSATRATELVQIMQYEIARVRSQ